MEHRRVLGRPLAQTKRMRRHLASERRSHREGGEPWGSASYFADLLAVRARIFSAICSIFSSFSSIAPSRSSTFFSALPESTKYVGAAEPADPACSLAPGRAVGPLNPN